ncbi:hypothetical protein N1851_021343 [Merluccius polli]|uniref:Uncharacterized protein n=1 Tax=Merluccius polli TaxID=89951 RepID=A0AA47NWP2_MERPO|nr:hypothetical protein N1851_021343 [Merluccius polli]
MEASAIQLDRMKFGSKISSVAGGSVGAIGGVLTIISLALAPVTAGVSLGLTMTGLGLAVTNIGQAAVKGPAALSKTARAGFITFNALFIGLDIYVICKESISLAKGDTSEISQFIRARAALLRSELNTWHRMHESLNQGMLESEKGPKYPGATKRSGDVAVKSKWVLERKRELDMLRDIQERAEQLTRSLVQVFKSTKKGKALGEYFKNKMHSRSKHEGARERAGYCVEGTLWKELRSLPTSWMLWRRLACHSLHVFTGGEEVVKPVSGDLPSKELWTASLLPGWSVLSSCSLRDDAGVFFQPSLHNWPSLWLRLDKYIHTTEEESV